MINFVVNVCDVMFEGGKLVIWFFMFEKFEIENVKVNILIVFGEYVLIEVEDIGMGIEKEIFDKIFEFFFIMKNVGEGIGFGFLIVYGIIK